MENFPITHTASGFRIEGFPNAVKVVRINGPRPKRLANLALHRTDLDFASECLSAINSVPGLPVIRQALWRSAIVHFTKCFGGSVSRFNLSAPKIYKGEALALENFAYFQSLRDKHLMHDENTYAQCLPGAVINGREQTQKVAKIVCFSMIAETLDQQSYVNLGLLIKAARSWVVQQFEALGNMLKSELESEPYEDLLGREAITYSLPKVEEIDQPREEP